MRKTVRSTRDEGSKGEGEAMTGGTLQSWGVGRGDWRRESEMSDASLEMHFYGMLEGDHLSLKPHLSHI